MYPLIFMYTYKQLCIHKYFRNNLIFCKMYSRYNT
jgi:hypothetical protein